MGEKEDKQLNKIIKLIIWKRMEVGSGLITGLAKGPQEEKRQGSEGAHSFSRAQKNRFRN